MRKLWNNQFTSSLKSNPYLPDFNRGAIVFDFPITQIYGKMRYSRLVIIPRSFIKDRKEVERLWRFGLHGYRKPANGDFDSLTIVVLAMRVGERERELYKFERIGRRSKAEFMLFIGSPARSMSKLLTILIEFFEKKLKGFLRTFNLTQFLRSLAYSLGDKATYIRTKKPRIILSSFWKWRPRAVDYIKSVKSWWLRSALKGLMHLLNELIDAFIKISKTEVKLELEISQIVKHTAKRIGNVRTLPEKVKRLITLALISQSLSPKRDIPTLRLPQMPPPLHNLSF